MGNETSKDDVIENSFSDDYYNIVSSKGSLIRERFYSNLANNQDDYKTVGRGLQLLSLDYFSNDTHYMKERELHYNKRLSGINFKRFKLSLFFTNS